MRVNAGGSTFPERVSIPVAFLERRLSAYSCEDSCGLGLVNAKPHRIPFFRNCGTVSRKANALPEKVSKRMSALGHKQTFLDYPQNVRFRG